MTNKRIISRIDVKNDSVIKGIHLEGLRKVGDPNKLAIKYYQDGVDEIIFMDAVAAYYDRNSLSHIIEKACENVFVPITVGGGIRKIQDIQIALNSVADKIAINTAAVKNPEFIKEASKVFGSQCIVSSIEAKKKSENKWEVYIDNGREPTGIDVIDWVKKVQKLGAGEIMVTSIDQEGTKNGFDLELAKNIDNLIDIPLIFCGGAGSSEDIFDVFNASSVDAIAIASILHYNIESVNDIKTLLKEKKINLRQ